MEEGRILENWCSFRRRRSLFLDYSCVRDASTGSQRDVTVDRERAVGAVIAARQRDVNAFEIFTLGHPVDKLVFHFSKDFTAEA